MEKITEQLDVLYLNFTKKGDLIYHEGPILSHFTGSDGHDYFFYWVDADDECNRWMVFKVTNLKKFFSKKCNLQDLIKFCPSGFVYYIDIDDNIEFKKIFKSNIDNIPASYLPSEKSFYNERHYEKYAETLKRGLNKACKKVPNNKFYLIMYAQDKNRTIPYSLKKGMIISNNDLDRFLQKNVRNTFNQFL